MIESYIINNNSKISSKIMQSLTITVWIESAAFTIQAVISILKSKSLINTIIIREVISSQGRKECRVHIHFILDSRWPKIANLWSNKHRKLPSILIRWISLLRRISSRLRYSNSRLSRRIVTKEGTYWTILAIWGDLGSFFLTITRKRSCSKSG